MSTSLQGDLTVDLDQNPKGNLQKLKDVVHYVCAHCRQDELGNVKLHKILYFADMLHFLSVNKPLTGVEYQKQNFGPVARHLSWALNELCKEGVLRVQKRDYYGFKKTDYLSLQSPSPSRLSNSEIALINDVVGFVCERSAKEISELSHMEPWKAAEIGEVLPYYSALGLLPSVATDDDVEDAVAEARAIRHEIENEAARC
jgi:uncharacterized phage-associated protein